MGGGGVRVGVVVGSRRQLGGQFDLGVGFALILSAFCTPHRIPTAARSSEAAERQIINQKNTPPLTAKTHQERPCLHTEWAPQDGGRGVGGSCLCQ